MASKYEQRKWDTFQQQASDKLQNGNAWDEVHRITKWVLAVIVFILVLFSAIISTLGVHVLASNLAVPGNQNVPSLKTWNNHLRYETYNKRVHSNEHATVTNVSYIWALYLILIAPYLKSVIYIAWKLALQRFTGWNCWVFFLAFLEMIVSTVSTTGTCFLVFCILPSLDPLSGILYCNMFVYSLLIHRVTSMYSTGKVLLSAGHIETKDVFSIAKHMCLILLCICTIVLPPVMFALGRDERQIHDPGLGQSLSLYIFVPMMISIEWLWTLVPDQHDVEATKLSLLPFLKQELHKHRLPIYLLSNIWRIVVSFSMVLFIFGSNCDGGKLDCIRTLFGMQRRAFLASKPLLGLTLIDSTTYSDPFVIAIITMLTSYVCFKSCVVAVKVCLKVSFVGPLILSAFVSPLLVILLYKTDIFGLTKYGFPSWQGGFEWDYQSWHVLTLVLSLVMVCLSCVPIWYSKSERMLSESRIFFKSPYYGLPLHQSMVLNRWIRPSEPESEERKDTCNSWFKCCGTDSESDSEENRLVRDDQNEEDGRSGIFESWPEHITKRFSDYSTCWPCKKKRVTQSTNGNNGSIEETSFSDRIDRAIEIPDIPEDAPLIYLCATMWHENHEEMLQLLTSIFRLEKDQWMNRLCHEKIKQDIYRFEVHVFFDDAFKAGSSEPNEFVDDFREAVKEASMRVYSSRVKLAKPETFTTPYGRQLHYKMPLGFKMVVHLKDKTKIRIKKRWSQVMYIYYLLSYKTNERVANSGTVNEMDGVSNRTETGNEAETSRKTIFGMKRASRRDENVNETEETANGTVPDNRMNNDTGVDTETGTKLENEMKNANDNVYILALDGDVDFQPVAVYLLVQRMASNKDVGAACGRIHAIGSGPMVWYQKFEYAVSHWLQKATEHVTGSILCGPGCFTLFRGSAITDDNVAKTYTSSPTEAKHYLQYDQGEDRWLCTLLLKQGKKLEYIAASDSYTFAPEGFKAFYKQRRRWGPSTMANIMDLLMDTGTVTKNNTSISRLYMAYQLFLFITSVLTPGTIFLMILGATKLAYPTLSLTWLLIVNIVPVIAFVLFCLFGSSEGQLKFAAVLSVIYSIIMMIVLVGVVQQGVDTGVCSITIMFIIFVGGVFLTTALLHPKEWSCVVYGLLYFLVTPSMQMLLIIYSITNLNNVSWGTRESATQGQQNEGYLDRIKGFLRRCCPSGTDSTSTPPVEVSSEQDTEGSSESRCASARNVHIEEEEHRELDEREEQFWKGVIATYLQPAGPVDEESQQKVKKDLLKLRDKMTLAFLLMNAIFVTVVFYLQKMNEDADRRYSIPLPCGNGEDIEPIGLAFTFVFGIMLFIQYVCMLAHRWKTFLVIMANTSLRKKGSWNTVRDIFDEGFRRVNPTGGEDLGRSVINHIRRENDEAEEADAEDGDGFDESDERNTNRSPAAVEHDTLFLQSVVSHDFDRGEFQNNAAPPATSQHSASSEANRRPKSGKQRSSHQMSGEANRRPKSGRQRIQQDIAKSPHQQKLMRENTVVSDIFKLDRKISERP